MEAHYVYIIQSQKDNTFYKGYTTDYIRRVESHNMGQSRYTSNKLPWVLVYVEGFASKKEALVKEKKLKRENSDYLNWLLCQPTNILNG